MYFPHLRVEETSKERVYFMQGILNSFGDTLLPDLKSKTRCLDRSPVDANYSEMTKLLFSS